MVEHLAGCQALGLILNMTEKESKQGWVSFITRSNFVCFDTFDLNVNGHFSISAVALYLVDQWWAIDDIVKTSEPSREGLKQVIRSCPSVIPVKCSFQKLFNFSPIFITKLH